MTRIGAVENRSLRVLNAESASVDQWNVILVEVSRVRGETMELKFLMNRR